MIAGMNIVRINFAHGDFDSHRHTIATVRAAAAARDKRVAIMGDLPGPKMRIGKLAHEPIETGARPVLSSRQRTLQARSGVSINLPACRAWSGPATASSSTTAWSRSQ